MVIMLWQRLHAFRVFESDDNYVPRACGDLRSVKNTMLPKEGSRKLLGKLLINLFIFLSTLLLQQ